MNKDKNKNSSAKALSDEALENASGGDIIKRKDEDGKIYYMASGVRRKENGEFDYITFVGRFSGENALAKAEEAIDAYNLKHPDNPVSKDFYDYT